VRERRERELQLIEAEYGKLQRDPELNWFIIERWPLPAGWNLEETRLLVLVPAGYPVTPPDNFYVGSDVRLASGAQPGNTSLDQQLVGKGWVLFSWHVEGGDWQPHADPLQGHNLLTFLASVKRRLQEAN
jgi:hypothetical protein